MRYLFFFSFLFLQTENLQSQKAIISVKAPELVSMFEKETGVVVVNFWSTWCKPCTEEIPYFLEAVKNSKDAGAKLWLVSQDTRSIFNSGQLKDFLKKMKWAPDKMFWFNETDADYYCPLIDKSWSGVVPATIILNNEKKYYRFYEEPLSREELERQIELAR